MVTVMFPATDGPLTNATTLPRSPDLIVKCSNQPHLLTMQPCPQHHSPLKPQHLIASLLLLLPFATQAATTFTIMPWTTDASTGISSANTYTHAYYLAPFTTPAGTTTTTVLNGVTFTGLNPAANAGGVSGSSLSSSIAGTFTSTNFTVRSTSNLSNNITSAVGAGYDASKNLAANRALATAGTTSQSLTLSGLSIGQEYQLSLFTVGFTDNRSVTYTLAGSSSDIYTFGGSTPEATYGSHNGAIVNMTYTATATDMTLTLATSGGSSHLYAFANAIVVPEPSRALLSLLSIGLLLTHRRR